MRLFVAFLAGIVPLVVFFALLLWENLKRLQSKMPLTAWLLRPPGESLRLEKMDESVNDGLLWLFACAIFVGFGAWSCYLYPLVGGIILILSLLLFIFLSRYLLILVRDRRNSYLGFLGERAVGEELNSLLADGWKVFHDVEFDENPSSTPFNVDHVVVGIGGILAIETKARRKQVSRSKGESSNMVIFDGTALEYPWGRETFGINDAVERADYLSRWLTQKLQTPCPVVPVLALPGWFVNRKGRSALRVVSGREICQLFRPPNSKFGIDPATVKAVTALLDQKCRDVGRDP